MIAAGVVVLILFGSLFPFDFYANPNPSGPFAALIRTYRTPPGRGDLIANILLYLPLGFFSVLACSREPRFGHVLILIFAGWALSTGIELTQFYDRGRDSALSDVYANVAGTGLGALIGLILHKEFRLPAFGSTKHHPFVVLLLACWLGYRLFPYAPTIDLHKYWNAVKPLLFAHTLPLPDLYRHTVGWLAIALVIEALVGAARSKWVFLLFMPVVLFTRILVVDVTLSPAEVVGGIVASLAWVGLLSRLRMGVLVIAVMFAGGVIVQGLAPFRFTANARPFGWIPFRSFLQGSIATNIPSFFEKAFTYGTLTWLFVRAGYSLRTVTVIGGTLVLCLRLGQVYIPGRSAEITDVVMLLILAAMMKLMSEDQRISVDGPDSNEVGSRWSSLSLRLHAGLTLSDSTTPADLIYVMAGRMDRKPYGLELYRAGLAPRLVLGVGRFEVSKMHTVGLDHSLVQDLIALRDKTPADQRHFWVKLETSGVSIEKRVLRRWSTYGEILDLQDFLEAGNVRRVIVVSTDAHLRRVALTCARVSRGSSIEFLYCPVPSRFGSLGKHRWWTRADDRRFIIKEMMKLAAYRVILSMPAGVSDRLMRLKA